MRAGSKLLNLCLAIQANPPGASKKLVTKKIPAFTGLVPVEAGIDDDPEG